MLDLYDQYVMTLALSINNLLSTSLSFITAFNNLAKFLHSLDMSSSTYN